MKLPELRNDGLRLHALAEFDIHLPRLHQPITSDNEFGRHGQKIGVISVVLLELHAGLAVKLPDLVSDPENQIKRKRVAEIDVAEHGKGQTVFAGIALSKFCSVRHDGDRTRSEPFDFAVDFRERTQIELAIWTPVAPVKADNHRSGPQKGSERHEPPVLVGKVKLPHRFAKLRTDLAAIDHVESLNKFIVGLGEIGPP